MNPVRPGYPVPLVMFLTLAGAVPALADGLEPAVPSLSNSQVERLNQGEVLVEIVPGAVPIGDALGVINAPPERIAAVLQDFANYPEWMGDISDAEVLGQEGNALICRGVTDTPWPMEDREWTVRGTSGPLQVEGIDTIVNAWEYVPGSGNILDSRGYWLLIPWGEDGSQTLVRYHLSVDLGTWLPDFLLEWSTENFLPTKISELREHLGV